MAIVGVILRGLPALASWLGTALSALFGWLIAALLAASVLMLDKVALLAAHVVGWLLRTLVGLVTTILGWLVDALPDMPVGLPDVSGAWSVLLEGAAIANRYVPVTEFLQYLSIYAMLYGLLFVWKAIRFVRGGG